MPVCSTFPSCCPRAIRQAWARPFSPSSRRGHSRRLNRPSKPFVRRLYRSSPSLRLPRSTRSCSSTTGHCTSHWALSVQNPSRLADCCRRYGELQAKQACGPKCRMAFQAVFSHSRCQALLGNTLPEAPLPVLLIRHVIATADAVNIENGDYITVEGFTIRNTGGRIT